MVGSNEIDVGMKTDVQTHHMLKDDYGVIFKLNIEVLLLVAGVVDILSESAIHVFLQYGIYILICFLYCSGVCFSFFDEIEQAVLIYIQVLVQWQVTDAQVPVHKALVAVVF